MARATEPAWLVEARKHLNLREYPGSRHNPTIMAWARALGSKYLGMNYTNDETPWCGLFVAHCIKTAGYEPVKIAVRAKAWAAWGRQLVGPRLGCVLVFDRAGGGHVGFYVGEDDTNYWVLGGNQGNAVTEMKLAKNRLVAGGMRWPDGAELPPVKIVRRTGAGVVSTNEA